MIIINLDTMKNTISFMILVIFWLLITIFIPTSYTCENITTNWKEVLLSSDILWWEHIREKNFIWRYWTNKTTWKTYKCILSPQDKNSF